MTIKKGYYCRLCDAEYVHLGSALTHVERLHKIAPPAATDALSWYADRRPRLATSVRPLPGPGGTT